MKDASIQIGHRLVSGIFANGFTDLNRKCSPKEGDLSQRRAVKI